MLEARHESGHDAPPYGIGRRFRRGLDCEGSICTLHRAFTASDQARSGRCVLGSLVNDTSLHRPMTSRSADTDIDVAVAPSRAVMTNGVPPLTRIDASWYAREAPEYRTCGSNSSPR